MSKIENTIQNLINLDDFADKDTIIHRLNPVANLVTTILYVIVIASFGKYDFALLLPAIIYPMVLIILGEIPFKQIAYRVLMIEPIIIGIAILNPIFSDKGWLIFWTIILKSTLTIFATLAMIYTMGIEKLAISLRTLKVPNMFITQLMLVFRYISVLVDEVFLMLRAYNLRSFNSKGIKIKDSGSFVGQLILRTYERSNNIYIAMKLRGFTGEFDVSNEKMNTRDIGYIIFWGAVFVLIRFINIPEVLGNIL